jgi:hypothetical protein
MNTACIMGSFINRAAGQYLEIIENLNKSWPSIVVPAQGSFISI